MTTSADSIPGRMRFLSNLVGGPSALARLLGIHKTTIFDYLKADAVIPEARLHVIAAKFPCNLAWLKDGKGAAPSPDPARTLAASLQRITRSDAKLNNGRDNGVDIRVRTKRGILVLNADNILVESLVSTRLKELIRMHGAERLATIIGAEMLALIQADRVIPRRNELIRISDELGIRMEWLTGEEG